MKSAATNYIFHESEHSGRSLTAWAGRRYKQANRPVAFT